MLRDNWSKIMDGISVEMCAKWNDRSTLQGEQSIILHFQNDTEKQ
jgi:hypothetical protein